MVDCGYLGYAQTFGDGNDRSIDRAEGKAGIGTHQLGHPGQVGVASGFEQQVSVCHRLEEGSLSMGAHAGSGQVADLGKHGSRYDERATGGEQEVPASRMVCRQR